MTQPINGFEHIYQDHGSARTLLLLHGTGGNEHDLLPIAEALDPAANVLSPRGKVLEGNMPRFFRRLAEGVFDREDLQARSKELAVFIKESSRKYGFVPEGVVAVGYSNGANIALHLIASNPQALSQGILLRPMSAALPDIISDLAHVRLLILSGTLDPMVAPEDADNTCARLSAKGALVEAQKINTGHGIVPEDMTYASAWLPSISH